MKRIEIEMKRKRHRNHPSSDSFLRAYNSHCWSSRNSESGTQYESPMWMAATMYMRHHLPPPRTQLHRKADQKRCWAQTQWLLRGLTSRLLSQIPAPQFAFNSAVVVSNTYYTHNQAVLAITNELKSNCLSADEWINKKWYTIEYYLITRKSELWCIVLCEWILKTLYKVKQKKRSNTELICLCKWPEEAYLERQRVD